MARRRQFEGSGRRAGIAGVTIAGLLLLPSPPATASGGSTTLASVIDGTITEYAFLPSLSGDGAVVVFGATTEDGNHLWARHLPSGQVEMVDVDADGAPAPIGSQFEGWDVSEDGRYVVFATDAPFAGTGCGQTGAEDEVQFEEPCFQVYRRDILAGETVLVSRETDDRPAFGGASQPAISNDGTVVTFVTGLVNQPQGAPSPRVLLRDVGSSATEVVSVSSDEVAANAGSYEADISGDGGTVAFASSATNLGANAGPGSDVFIRDRVAGTTEPIFGPSTPVLQPGETNSPSLSDDGTIVAFMTQASLVAGDNAGWNVHAIDRTTGALTSPTPDAILQDRPQLSGDGRFLLFRGGGGSLPQWTPGRSDVYIHQIATGTTSLAALSATGTQVNAGTDSGFHSISADGRFVAFSTMASNVTTTPVPAGSYQVYVHDREAAPAGGDIDPQDGIDDSLQPAGTAALSFVDESTDPDTVGRLVGANGLTGRITDAADPDDGVLVTVDAGVGGPAELQVCGMTVQVAAGSEVVFTCGSLIVAPVSGPPVEIVLDGGDIVVTVAAGSSVEIEDTDEGARIVAVSGTGVTATVNGTTTPVTEPTDITPITWVITGFEAPVDNAPVLNKGKAGRAIPLKWHVADGDGNPVTTLTGSDVSISVTHLECGLGTSTDTLEQTFAGGSGLINHGNGDYQLNWKTNSAWARSCKTMTLDVGGIVSKEALFTFIK